MLYWHLAFSNTAKYIPPMRYLAKLKDTVVSQASIMLQEAQPTGRVGWLFLPLLSPCLTRGTTAFGIIVAFWVYCHCSSHVRPQANSPKRTTQPRDRPKCMMIGPRRDCLVTYLYRVSKWEWNDYVIIALDLPPPPWFPRPLEIWTKTHVLTYNLLSYGDRTNV